MLTTSQEKILKDIAAKHNIDYDTALSIYKSQFGFIRSITSSFNFDDMSIEDIEKTKKNFNLPALGKLYVQMVAVKKIHESVNKKINKE